MTSENVGIFGVLHAVDNRGFKGVPLFYEFFNALSVRFGRTRHALNVARLPGRVRLTFIFVALLVTPTICNHRSCLVE